MLFLFSFANWDEILHICRECGETTAPCCPVPEIKRAAPAVEPAPLLETDETNETYEALLEHEFGVTISRFLEEGGEMIEV